MRDLLDVRSRRGQPPVDHAGDPAWRELRPYPRETYTLELPADADDTGPQVSMYRGRDGAWVVEIDTTGLEEPDPSVAEGGVPYLRVWVNEAKVSDETPPAPLPRSRSAHGIDH